MATIVRNYKDVPEAQALALRLLLLMTRAPAACAGSDQDCAKECTGSQALPGSEVEWSIVSSEEGCRERRPCAQASNTGAPRRRLGDCHLDGEQHDDCTK
jgi:hypothetical protein